MLPALFDIDVAALMPLMLIRHMRASPPC